MEVNTEGPKYGDNFFKTFGASSRATISSTEIKCAPTLSQTLHMAVGDTIDPRLSAGGTLQTLVATKATPEEVIEELFLLAISRRPTTQEAQELRTLIGTETKNPQAYEDIFWALLNSTEFIFNH